MAIFSNSILTKPLPTSTGSSLYLFFV